MKILKTLIITVCLSLSFFAININSSYAEWEWMTVKVTEKVPGANCWDEIVNKNDKWEVTSRYYECTVKKWFDSVMDVASKMIKFATLIASLGWVLFIVINWIAISASGVDSSAKEAAKGRITKTIIWLILLLLSWTLLNIIAPWIYR